MLPKGRDETKGLLLLQTLYLLMKTNIQVELNLKFLTQFLHTKTVTKEWISVAQELTDFAG